ncbi:hypothetical protein D3C73_363560 [compost metagenome]
MRHMSRHAASAAVLSFAVLTGAMAGADPARAAGASEAAVAPAAVWDARIDLDYQPLASRSGVQDLNFYLLTLLEQTPAALAALNADPDLGAIRQAAAQRALAAAAACEASVEAAGQAVAENPAPACTVQALRWTDDERARAAQAAGRLFDRSPAVRALVGEHMRPSGRFQRDAALDDRALFVRAWIEAHEAIDRIIRVYALGEAPRYADIDSAIYPVEGRYYQGFLVQLVREVARRADQPGPAYDLARAFALELMDANRRDDAVRQTELQTYENAATLARLAQVRWADFPYAAILVPGYSPEIAYEPLNPAAKLRIRRGVEHYRAGKAPVIIVSGGTLRPAGTPYNEALEMKRFLIAHHGVPADAILIDPAARHTTNNMRNAARLIFSTRAPRGMKSLVTGQVSYIGSASFAARNQRDFGYVPYVLHDRLDFDTYEFTPVPASLHREATDPMDP